MYEQTNTMMETKTTFQIPQLLDGDDFTSEDLADDMEGLRLSFTRIKIPGGGHLQFEIPSGNPDVPDYAPYLEGVILYSHNSNAYWPEGSEYDDDQPPLCQSFDGKVGYGEPGGTCADCVLNQFGSDGNNKGKACKNMRMLYLLRSGEYMPIQIALALADAFGCGVNELPLSMVLSWYEQKAVCILLTLLYLGIKDIRLGPTLPAILSPNVLDYLVKNFGIAPITTPEEDLKAILG